MTMEMCSEGENSTSQEWLQGAETPQDYERRLAVRLYYLKYSVPVIAHILGSSPPTIWRWLKTYRENGLNPPVGGNWGGRRHSVLSSEQEIAFQQFYQQQLATGVRLTCRELGNHIHEQTGKKVSCNYIYNLLRRLGFPATKNPCSPPSPPSDTLSS